MTGGSISHDNFCYFDHSTTWQINGRPDPVRLRRYNTLVLYSSFAVTSQQNTTQHITLSLSLSFSRIFWNSSLSSVTLWIQKTQNTIEYSLTILFYLSCKIKTPNNGRSKKRANRWRWIGCRNSFCWRFWWCTSLHSRISLHALSPKRINHFLPFFSVCLFTFPREPFFNYAILFIFFLLSFCFFLFYWWTHQLLFIFVSSVTENPFPNFSSYFFNTMCVVACFSIPGFNTGNWNYY